VTAIIENPNILHPIIFWRPALGKKPMKKAILAIAAVAAMTASASAADLAARLYEKAPPPVAPAYNWTGFYIFGGGGGGLWAADTNAQLTGTGVPLNINQRQGGSGWYGTVGAGYDWQFNTWVGGIFADGQFGSIRGTIQDPVFGISGTEKMQDAWAVGLRLGYLVAPNVLSYVNGGYTGSHWSGTSMFDLGGLPVGVHTDSFNRNGWFVGGGVENSLNFFGISSPGWFMKTEYRAAWYQRNDISEIFDGTNTFVGNDIRFKPVVQTISTSLVYRFNWTGAPVISKY
jgi:outer membrane immunogenic protein